jgi:sugar lactone lactonase YvrE
MRLRFALTGVLLAFVGSAPAQTLFVSDFSNNRVHRYSTSGSAQGGALGPNGLNGPAPLARDAAGNLYVGNYNSGVIRRFSPMGADLGNFATIAGSVNGLAFDAAGRLYVGNYTGGTITRFPAGGGAGELFASGLVGPREIRFDAAGTTLYVAEREGNRVTRFSAAGGAGTPFATVGVSAPYGLAFDAQGRLYVSNEFENVVRRYTAAGALDGVFATSPNTTAGAASIGFDATGQLYMANVGIGVEQFSPTGTYQGVFAGETGASSGLALTPDFVGTPVPEPLGVLAVAAAVVTGWLARRKISGPTDPTPTTE